MEEASKVQKEIIKGYFKINDMDMIVGDLSNGLELWYPDGLFVWNDPGLCSDRRLGFLAQDKKTKDLVLISLAIGDAIFPVKNSSSHFDVYKSYMFGIDVKTVFNTEDHNVAEIMEKEGLERADLPYQLGIIRHKLAQKEDSKNGRVEILKGHLKLQGVDNANVYVLKNGFMAIRRQKGGYAIVYPAQRKHTKEIELLVFAKGILMSNKKSHANGVYEIYEDWRNDGSDKKKIIDTKTFKVSDLDEMELEELSVPHRLETIRFQLQKKQEENEAKQIAKHDAKNPIKRAITSRLFNFWKD